VLPLPRGTIVRMYLKGTSLYALSKEFKVARETLRRIIVEEGHSIRPSTNGCGGPRRSAVVKLLARHGDDIIRRYVNGESGKMLAKAYGLSQVSIFRHLDDSGVPRRSLSAAQRVRRQHGR
jgi:hypothetical protein